MFLAMMLTLVLRFTRSPAARSVSLLGTIALAAWAGRTIMNATPDGYFETGGFDMLRTAVTSFWVSMAVGTVMAVYYVAWERSQRTVRALHGAQLAQQRSEHGVLEARLNVMRARVEPAFLFEALGAARRLYAGDAVAAERMLEDLIRYLRASLPQAREQGSTLPEEVHLAASYLEVCSALGGRRFRLDAQLAPGFADIFFPPRVLLPLVEDAVARASGDAPAIRVRAGLEAGRARVVIEDDGAAGEHRLAALRDVATTLKAFYGPDASIDARAVVTARVVTLEFLAMPLAPHKDMP
jgi:LytS/YehU family sensor histidine kinase